MSSSDLTQRHGKGFSRSKYATYEMNSQLFVQKYQLYLPDREELRRELELTLDHLLDCACIPEGLALFKALCRHYHGIDSAATATYVYAYRDLWDSEEAQPQGVAS